MDDQLKSIWDSHSGCVRRVLIGLTHNTDLAEDLLQETYLRAWKGISGFRGDNARAWLCTIARNVFYSYVRRLNVISEVPFDIGRHFADVEYVGSESHVEHIDLRRLLSELPEKMRTAFLLKYHAGYSYPEIAEHMECAPITARWRVRKAMSLVRSMLDESQLPTGPACATMSTDRILDYFYNLLRPSSVIEMEDHVRNCEKCGIRFDEVRIVLEGLDSLASRNKMMHLVDVNAQGMPSLCAVTGSQNLLDQPRDSISFQAGKDCRLRSVTIPGYRLSYDARQSPSHPAWLHYTAQLPRIVVPGQEFRYVTAWGAIPNRRANRITNNAYRLSWDQLPSDTHEGAYMQVVRLPARARILLSDPEPVEVTNGASTCLIWQSNLAPSERFRSTIEYCLDS